MKAFVLAFVALCAIAGPARGQAASSTNAEARRHFQNGLKNAERGDLRTALHEFEAAYAVQPNFSVLYNIGQAHAALGHPVAAIAAFERYVAEGGEQISDSRRDEVADILTRNRARIGMLQLVAPTTARMRVWVDGSEVPPERWRAAMPLAAGQHSVLSFEEGCSPASQAPVVLAGTTIALELAQGTACTKPLGQLEIDCEVPDVEVDVGGVLKARTPLKRPLLAPIGEMVVRFHRSGYGPVSRSVRVNPNELVRVACEQRPLKPLPPTLTAHLLVDRSPADATVLVDGQPFAGSPLPAGAHEVVVEHDGFEPMRRLTSLPPGQTSVLSMALQKDAKSLARDAALASRRKKVALVLGGVGISFLGSAGGLYAWNSRRYTDWRDGAASADGRANLGLATSVQRVDDLSLAFAVLGASLTGAGAWLFLTME